MTQTAANLADSCAAKSLRHRVRLGAFAMITLVSTIVAGMQFAGTSLFPHLFGDDLIPSYMAGTFVREGQSQKLMDYHAAEHFQAHLRRTEGLEQHGRTGPWLNPPFYALLFAPLSVLPFRAALWTWFGFNTLMLGASVALLFRMLPVALRLPGDAAAIAALLLFSFPGLQAMASQQNTFLSLLILTAAVTFWRADRPLAAGVVAGLLAFKPQLALLVWAAIACLLGWRALAGIVLTVGVLGAVTLLVLPGTLTDYLQNLSAALPYLRTERPYPWERQMTFQGFFRLLLQGRVGGEALLWVKVLWPVCAGCVALLLGRAIYWSRRRMLGPVHRDRLIAATIAAMPLMMPYYMDYDLLLMAIPVTLIAAERMNLRSASGSRRIIGAWTFVYCWVFFNAAFGESTGISLTVVALASIGIVMAFRARGTAIAVIDSEDAPILEEPLRLAA